MKSKNLIIGLLCLFVLMVAFSMTTKSQKPEEAPKFERIEVATGGPPHWSPDGTKLAFISGGWLCVANVDGKGEIQKIVQLQFNSFDWMDDSTFVVSENIPWTPEGKGRGHKLAIRSVDMRGQIRTIREDSIIVIPQSEYLTYGSVPVTLRDGTVGYYEIHEKPGGEGRVFKIIKEGKLKPEAALKQMHLAGEGLESIDGTIKKRLPIDKKYGYRKLSPDDTKILAGVSGYSAGIVILNLKGEVLTDLDVNAQEISPGVFAVGEILGSSWSPDSKKILYTLTVEDGDSVYDNDIYMVNVDGTGKVAIAATPNDIERDASWSPDGKKIAYRSETSGKIFVVKLK
jgi:WD40 repeat protein